MLTNELKQLSKSEKLLLINDLWDDVVSASDDLDISSELAVKLDKRYQDFVKNPNDGISWKTFKSRFA